MGRWLDSPGVRFEGWALWLAGLGVEGMFPAERNPRRKDTELVDTQQAGGRGKQQPHSSEAGAGLTLRSPSGVDMLHAANPAAWRFLPGWLAH